MILAFVKIIEGLSAVVAPIFFDKFVKTELGNMSKLGFIIIVPVIVGAIYVYEVKYDKDEPPTTTQSPVVVNYVNGVRSERPVKEYDIESLFKDDEDRHPIFDLNDSQLNDSQSDDNHTGDNQRDSSHTGSSNTGSSHTDNSNTGSDCQCTVPNELINNRPNTVKLKEYDKKIASIDKDIKKISRIIAADVQDYKISVNILMAQLKLNRDELDRSLSAIRKETDNSLQVIATVTNMSLNKVNEQSKNISKLMNRVNDQLALFSGKVETLELDMDSLSKISFLTPFDCPNGFIDMLYGDDFDSDIMGNISKEELLDMRGKLLTIGENTTTYAINGVETDSVEIHLCVKDRNAN